MILEDKYMTYDYTFHLYLPTQELIQEKLNINLVDELGDENEKNAFLEDVAYYIKDFCIAYDMGGNPSYVKQQYEYQLYNNVQSEREYLQRAYVELVRYAINDEGDLVGAQTGLNLINGQVVPISELRGRRELSGRLERILYNSGLLVGTRAWEIPDDAVYGTDY